MAEYYAKDKDTPSFDILLDNDDKYGLFKFDTLHKISNSNGKIRLNKLVSRDISYDGEKLIEKEPIYYGENFININNYENEKEIRKVLTK